MSTSNNTGPGLPPVPVAPPNVTSQGLPQTSVPLITSGGLLDFIPITITCTGTTYKGTLSAQPGYILGIIDPAGNVHTSYDFTATMGQVICTLMADPAASFVGGSVLQEVAFWSFIAGDIAPANTPPVTIQKTATYGVATAESDAFCVTVGAKVNTSFAELSTSLSETFQSSVSISEQSSVSESWPFNARPEEQVVGVYQLIRSFSVSPAGGLVSYVGFMNSWFGNQKASVAASIPGAFQYAAEMFVQVWGIDQTTGSVDAPSPSLLSTVANAARGSLTL